MNDSTADAADTTPLSIFTPRSQVLHPPIHPRPPSVLPRTSSPFSRRRSTISGAVSLEREDDTPTPGKIVVGDNTKGFAVPFAPSAWVARASKLDNASSPAGTAPGPGSRAKSAACFSRDSAISPSLSLELQAPGGNSIVQNTRKRPSDVGSPDGVAERAQFKRPRVKSRPSYSLDNLPKFDGPALEPPSPLFFSNTQRPRPQFPPRLSSSEAAASMLSKARQEETHVKTVSLARGTIPTPGPPSYFHSPTPTSHSRRNLDRASATRGDSPDTGSLSGKISGTSPGQNLNTIGIIELFEEDPRPTFIIDLSDSTIYGPGLLSPLYANTSLRSYEGLYESISGLLSPNAPGYEAFIPFKAWAIASVSGEGYNPYLPIHQYANILWSCSTIRKKLRVISGSFTTSPGLHSGTSSSTSPRSIGTVLKGPTSAPTPGSEASDYFGVPSNVSSVALPSIEGSTRRIEVPSASEGNTGIADQQTPVDQLTSPSAYVQDGTPLTAAVPAVTNINWFNSHVQSHTMSPSFDWTRLPISDAMPPHIRFARSIDWGATALGPIETWGPDLRQMCNLIMGMYLLGTILVFWSCADRSLKYVLLYCSETVPEVSLDSHCSTWRTRCMVLAVAGLCH